ncbi:mitochondrial inner membrane protein OXA1L-like isoform X2 [Watersipora subatra]|uniref:mitochondrial inner membrane protein OXA1L-like isoform X2 n=1 Tax=Watersipora subatra TaxID=2589382 RepID=UPI00355B3A7D
MRSGVQAVMRCARCHRNLLTMHSGRQLFRSPLPLQYSFNSHGNGSHRATNHRMLSTEPGASSNSATDSLGSGFLPPPPDPPLYTEQLTALGEPTLSSLGLGGYWPPGLVQSLLESIHTTFDIPWFASIIALTLAIRCLTLPITVMQLKNAARMNNHMPTLMKLQTQVAEAHRSKDIGKLEKYSKESSDYMKRNDVNPLKMVFRPLIAAPVFISVFSGLRGITSLPVESFKTGGALWFTDLTATDPYLILPLVSALTVAAVTRSGAEGASTQNMPPAMKVFINLMPAGIFAFTIFQPAALALYWTTSNIISLVYAKVLRTAYMRGVFNIPPMINHPPQDTPSIFNPSRTGTFQQSSELAQLQHEVNERRKVGALQYKQTPDGDSSTERTEDENSDTSSKPYDPADPKVYRNKET